MTTHSRLIAALSVAGLLTTGMAGPASACININVAPVVGVNLSFAADRGR